MIRSLLRLSQTFSSHPKNPQYTKQQQQPPEARKESSIADSYETLLQQLKIKDERSPQFRVPQPPSTKLNDTYKQAAIVSPKATQTTEDIKAKLLKGKCSKVAPNYSAFAHLGRPEQLYLVHRQIEDQKKRLQEKEDLDQLKQGEEGIDYYKVSPEYLQKVEEAESYGMHRLEDAYRAVKGLTTINAKRRTESIAQWREKHRSFMPINGQFSEPFELKEYPGSKKGPQPEHDPEYFVDWFSKNHPKKAVEATFEFATKILQRQPNRRMKDDDQDYEVIVRQPTVVFTHAHEALQPYVNRDYLTYDIEDIMAGAHHNWEHRSHDYENDIDILPDDLPLNPVRFWEAVEPWTQFRFMSLFFSFLEKVKEEQEPQNADTKIASLYPYYATLPKAVRESHLVKLAYKGLEYHKHSLTIQEKEKALNFVAYLSLEMDDVTKSVCEDLAQTRRHHPTVEDEKRLLYNNDKDVIDGCIQGPEYEKFMMSKPIFPVLNPPEGEYAYPYPERFKTDVADPTPVDYYQNDDGFWDDYIKHKLNRYMEAHRPSSGRLFYKH